MLLFRPLLVDGLVAAPGVVLGDHLQRELLRLPRSQRPRGHPVHHEPRVRLVARLQSREDALSGVRFGDTVLELGRRRCRPRYKRSSYFNSVRTDEYAM